MPSRLMLESPETKVLVKAVNRICMAESSQAQIFEHQISQHLLGNKITHWSPL